MGAPSGTFPVSVKLYPWGAAVGSAPTFPVLGEHKPWPPSTVVTAHDLVSRMKGLGSWGVVAKML